MAFNSKQSEAIITSLLNFWWWWWWGVVDDVFRTTAMPQCLTTELDTLAHQGVP